MTPMCDPVWFEDSQYLSRFSSHPSATDRWSIMNLMVHVKQRVVAVSCGDGSQPVRWLANVGTARYDSAQGRSLGMPIGVRLEDGTLLGLGQTLSEAGLSDMQHVWVLFKGVLSSEKLCRAARPRQPC